MLKARLAAAALPLLISTSLTAQGVEPQCPPGSAGAGTPDNAMVSQDACQKAIDLFRYLAPQLGTALAGGNPTQSLTSTVGGLGHFAIGLRANALRGSIPEVDKVLPSNRGAQQSTYSIENVPVGLIAGDLALGVFRGLPLGVTRVGGIDLLVSAAYVPNYTRGGLDVAAPSGSLKLGFGGKLGLVEESVFVPGVSVSFLERALPLVNVTASAGDDRLHLDSIKVRARSWRAVAGKSILFFGVAGGFGQDTYDSRSTISVTVAPRLATQGGSGGPVVLAQTLKRNNVFGSVWITSQVLRLVAEIGRVSGGEVQTYNQFSGTAAAAARTYASVGFSFGR